MTDATGEKRELEEITMNNDIPTSQITWKK